MCKCQISCAAVWSWLSTWIRILKFLQEECPRLWCISEQPPQPKPIEVIDIGDDGEEQVPQRPERRPWQLMGVFDDMRD